MPNSIASRQKAYVNSGQFGGEDADLFREVSTELEKFGAKFIEALGRKANEKQVVASGKLLSRAKVIINDDGMGLKVMMPDYFDFPNEGVQGVKSSKNAPGSPYKFKSYGMNAEGRRSIKDYIRSGRAKIAVVQKDKAYGIGLERKGKSLLDTQADQLIYLIKRFGIKKTGYFTEAVNEVFGKDFELKMTEALGRDIIFSIEKINR